MKKIITILLTLFLASFAVSIMAQETNVTPEQIQQQLAQVKQKQAQQAAAEAAAAKEQQASQRGDMSSQAFAGVVNQRLPLTPEQIENLHKAFMAARNAAAKPAGVPAKPTSSAVLVNLSPKAAPPVIRLGAGYITSLVFVDATGQPWPIKAYSVGDPTSFNIQWNKTSNILLVQSDTFYKRSNLAVLLDGLDTPIMLTLLPGQKAIDYRVDLRVPGIGPKAVIATENLPSTADPLLIDVLNGIPPKGARSLRVAGSYNCQAWLFNNKLYLRTPLEIISPAWQSVMSSIDGTHAYEMQPTAVILAFQHGKTNMLKLTLEGLE